MGGIKNPFKDSVDDINRLCSLHVSVYQSGLAMEDMHVIE